MTSASRFTLAMRVYWEDTDAGGIVYYANHLKFYERARTEWLRSLGFGQERMRVHASTLFVVAETAVKYHRPARLDDELRVSVAITVQRLASLELAQAARRGDELISEGTIRLGCVDARTLRPVRIPDDILQAIA